jgi:hypothetical protein
MYLSHDSICEAPLIGYFRVLDCRKGWCAKGHRGRATTTATRLVSPQQNKREPDAVELSLADEPKMRYRTAGLGMILNPQCIGLLACCGKPSSFHPGSFGRAG